MMKLKPLLALLAPARTERRRPSMVRRVRGEVLAIGGCAHLAAGGTRQEVVTSQQKSEHTRHKPRYRYYASTGKWVWSRMFWHWYENARSTYPYCLSDEWPKEKR